MARASRTFGFTLIEMIVVIAAIAVLISLVLPAAEASREAARRAECVGHLKQIGLACTLYESDHGSYPPGIKGSIWGTWMVFVLPYIEQQTLYNAWNSLGDNRDPALRPLSYRSAFNITVTSARLNAFTCPSDLPAENFPRTVNGRTYSITSHNYVVNFGNLFMFQDQLQSPSRPFLGAPFSDIGSPDLTLPRSNGNGPVKGLGTMGRNDISDGTSNTMLLSEVVQGQAGDLRGFAWWYGGAAFQAWLTPNSALPDQLEAASYCKYPGNNNPPCITAPTLLLITNGARSRHPGGVNVSYLDGSVRFISNTVNPHIWRAHSTTQGSELPLDCCRF